MFQINMVALQEAILVLTWKLVGAGVVLFIGFKIANFIAKLTKKVMVGKKVDETITNYTFSLTKIGIKAAVAISAVSILGVDTATFVAILAGMSFAVGLALQGSLQNFAGGVLLLVMKPFKVGDVVELIGYTGSVDAITIFYTHLNTPDNKLIIIPNGKIIDSSLMNYTKHDTRRLDITVGVDYGTDIEKVKEAVEEIIKVSEYMMNEPKPVIALTNLGDSSIDFDIKVWTKTSEYFTARYELYEAINNEFTKKGIEFPYPHMDVMIKKEIEA